jgi:tRNA modification GTPase
MMLRTEDTITALATGTGGAVSIIRISGSKSHEICQHIFSPFNKDLKLAGLKGYSVLFGEIISDNEIVDEVLVTVFKAPHSYTGEDSIEISCHASPYIQKRILELLLKAGSRAAQPGEFTQRAFLNKKIDLSQAEAVADVIASKSKSAHMIALNQMRGGFSDEILRLRTELLHFASLLELELDFGEEDIEFASRDDLKSVVINVKLISDNLADSFKTGNAIKNGIPAVIIGKPNSGKSTLLNALLMEERAIVSEIPGTTRDTIEDTIVIEGTEFRFIDTAGLRDTTDVIELLGIKKTHEKIDQASVILFIDEILDEPDSVIARIDSIRQLISETDKKLFIIINKIDKDVTGRAEAMNRMIKLNKAESLFFISAKDRSGLDNLRKALSESVVNDLFKSDDVIITNIRHYDVMIHVSESLSRVLFGLDNNVSADLIAIDIRQAIHYLGEITGEITTDEILGNIFKNFCIGK